MSKTGPPLSLLRRMGRGDFHATVSIACLSAALAVQRGDDSRPTIETVGGEPLSPKVKAAVEAAIERVREDFKTCTPEQLQDSIDLYVAHLRYCGYTAEWGTTN